MLQKQDISMIYSIIKKHTNTEINNNNYISI